MTAPATTIRVPCGTGELLAHVSGNSAWPAVILTHSILASSMMWERQVALLNSKGYRSVAIDTRGHGGSSAPTAPYTMDDLAADSIAVMNALQIEKAHYVGLSLGGMSGFGLGLHYPDRLLSMVLCDARADAPAPFAALWDERIAAAQQNGCESLAHSTAVRWFGQDFLDANPEVARRFVQTISATSVEGFVGCARAIQGLNYLHEVDKLTMPVTLIVGSKDKPLPEAMADLQKRIPGASIEVISDAGHLPNIDQPDAFEAAVLRHFDRLAHIEQ